MNNNHLKPMARTSSIISVMSLEDLFNSSRSRFNGPMFDSNAPSENDGYDSECTACGGAVGCEDLFNSSRSRFNSPMFDSNALSWNDDYDSECNSCVGSVGC